MRAILSVSPHPGGLCAFARRQPIGCRGHSSVAPVAGRASLPRREINSLNFKDHQVVYEHQSTEDIWWSLLVLQFCSFSPFAQHSEWLLQRNESRDTAAAAVATRMVPPWFLEAVYRHFCAGRSPSEVWARTNGLRAHGVAAILDLVETPEETGSAATPYQQHDEELKAEDEFDRRVDALIASVDMATAMPGTGFVVVHVPALSSPRLLEHVSAVLRQAFATFNPADVGMHTDTGTGDVEYGIASWETFQESYRKLAVAISDDAGVPRGLPSLASAAINADSSDGPHADYVSWCRQVKLRHLHLLAEGLQHLRDEEEEGEEDKLASSGTPGTASRRTTASRSASLTITPTQQQQLERLQNRLERLVERAEEKGVKLLFEADGRTEPHILWPALEHLAYGLMGKYNRTSANSAGEAVVFLSYGGTTASGRDVADVTRRLRAELSRAEREGYTLGVKLVDGPHVMGVPYANSIEILLRAARARRAELVLGSHSPAVVEAAVAGMVRVGLEAGEAPVYFQHLLGVADRLSFTLGKEGYKVYKYCPVGDVNKAMPYLVRRIQEMQVMLQGGGHHDLRLLQAELWRRLVHQPASELITQAEALFHPAASGSAAAQQQAVNGS
ncbi:hypothetical protein VaNZ11_016478 [Volvox africanus]|uniref:Proline dehydrogenase n=1 Tax=Volvox africanus TaxID=51714 RepID=A0ABQ5SNU4_9CHLO|nr:hypothetical protein VaNZ11_016478 [Volvox africanus]